MYRAYSLFFLILFLDFPNFLSAQITGGNVEGRILLEDGSAVPGAQITLSCMNGKEFGSVSDASGYYRFLKIPPGPCRVTCRLSGFMARFVDIVAQAGETRVVDIILKPGDIAEIEVAASPLGVDPRHTNIQAAVNAEDMVRLPTVHDPWSVLELAPGVVVREVNIGGARSGEQAYFYGHGEAMNNAQWFQDGVMITDYVERGASSRYIDFSSFETVHVQTGGADVETFTGGVTVNIISREGGKQWKAGGRFFYSDRFLQGSNLGSRPELALEEGENTLDRFIDYGFHVGGPLVHDRIFTVLTLGGQNFRRIAPTYLQKVKEATTLYDGMFRLTGDWKHHRLDLQAFLGGRAVDHEGGGFEKTPETTVRVEKRSPLFKLQYDSTPNPDWYITLQFAGTPGQKEDMFPHGGIEHPAVLDLNTGVWYDSFEWSRIRERTYQFVAQGQYFGGRWFGVENEWKFGFEARYFPITLENGLGNGLVIVYDDIRQPQAGGEARFIRMQKVRPWLWKFAGYLQDRINMARWSIYAGLRADIQTSGRRPASVAANPLVPEWLSNGTDPGDKLNFTWVTFSPRIGLAYDLLGDRTLMLKASSALYPANLDANQAISLSPTGLQEIDFAWLGDYDGDGFTDRDEIDFSQPLFWNHRLGQPNKVVNAVDPNFTSPKTWEIVLGADWTPDSRVRMQGFFMRRINYDRKENYPYDPDHPDNLQAYLQCWSVAGTIPAEFGGWPYYSCNLPRPDGEIWMNQPDYHRDYWGAELRIFTQPLHNFNLSASFNWERFIHHYQGRDAYIDPTNITQMDRAAVAFGNANIRWMAKILLTWRLPGGVDLGSSLQMRDGFPFLARYRVTRPSNGWGRTVNVFTAPPGSIRLPSLIYMNASIQKSFRLASHIQLSAIVDVFNIFNAATPLAKNTRADNPEIFGQIEDILAPRAVRLGLRIEY